MTMNSNPTENPARPGATGTVAYQTSTAGVDWRAVQRLFTLNAMGGRTPAKLARAYANSARVIFATAVEPDGAPEIIGTARVVSDNEYHAGLYDVVVHPDWQHQGIGRQMVHALLDGLPIWRMTLVCAPDLMDFYRQFGFEPLGGVMAKHQPEYLYNEYLAGAPVGGATLDSHNAHPALVRFRDLLSVASVSGNEAGVAARVQQQVRELGFTPELDADGNVLVRLAGRNPEAPLVCLAAHMDEIGMVVTRIEADGTLRVDRSGGLYPWKLGEGPVEIVGDTATITGVLSMGSTHSLDAAGQSMTWEKVRIITGLPPEQLTAAGVRPGSAAAPVQAFRGPVLLGDPADPLVAAWTFDDRMGCVALLRLLEAIRDAQLVPHQPTLIAFTISEEIGGLGAKSLALREQPELFIAVDGSPTPAEAPLAIDGRPGLWSKDRLAVYDQALVRDFLRLGREIDVEIQTAAYTGAASDASLVRYAGLTSRIVCFGHVRENSHGYEVARLAVFDRVVAVLAHFIATWQIG